MPAGSRIRSLAWLATIPVALALLAWFDRAAVRHVDALSARAIEAPALDADSPTGYADGKRYRVPLDHNSESYQWIAQAQELAAQGTWRLREVDFDNAPRTRPVWSPSPYRWWLTRLGAWRQSGDEPVGAAIERSAFVADVYLHVVLLLVIGGVVAWRFGFFACAMTVPALALMYPVLSAFYPGSPNDRGLVAALVAGSTLMLALGLTGKRPGWRFVVSGITGGLSVWVDPHRGVPVIAGLGLGGIAAAWWVSRSPRDQSDSSGPSWPWRTWAGAGAITVIGTFLVENAPDRLDVRTLSLQNNHPLYAVAWIGLGLLIARLQRGFAGGRTAWTKGAMIEATGGLLLVLALPITMLVLGQSGFLIGDSMSSQMSPIPGAERGASLVDWLVREGVRWSFWATMLPLSFAGLGLWRLLRQQLPPAFGAAVLVVLGAVLTGVGLGFDSIAWWSTTGTLVGMLIAVLAATCTDARSRRTMAILLAVVLLPSLLRLVPVSLPSAAGRLTNADERSLTERDLGYWLNKRVDDYRSVVLAPPEIVPALYYFGGVRGIGSPYQGNQEGFGAAVRIAATNSTDEAEALATQRELSHIVMPSWDDFLYRYAELGSAQPDRSIIAMLDNWLPPRWLRAVHHPLPEIEGFLGASAIVFEVVDVQDNATALSRLGEYFIESGRLELAQAIAVTLEQSFPSDLGGLVARAQVAVALTNRAEFQRAMDAILPYLEDARDGDLLWDRRVNLTNLLLLGQQDEFAREQLQYCMDEVDEYLLRTVTPPTLYRFMILANTLDEPFPEDYLREEALRQLPTELRTRLEAPR